MDAIIIFRYRDVKKALVKQLAAQRMLLHNIKKEFKKWRKLWTNLEENRLEPLREHGNDGKNVELHELQNEHNREVVQHNENETQSNEKH